MEDDGDQRSSSPARKWGCFAAALIGLPVFAFLFLLDALGDCAPDLPCEKGFLSEVLLPTGGIALAAGMFVWWLVNLARGNIR